MIKIRFVQFLLKVYQKYCSFCSARWLPAYLQTRSARGSQSLPLLELLLVGWVEEELPAMLLTEMFRYRRDTHPARFPVSGLVQRKNGN